jgi:NAD(P)-dependent dehydrogenase (short-subunit alcohol dehydrogenase family)
MKSLVTGAARGLGEAIVARLLRDGGSVALVDRDEAVRESAQRLTAGGDASRAFAVTGDVSDAGWAEQAVPEVIGRLGGIDLLVNNAGIGGPSTAVVDTAPDEFRRVLEVNLIGPFLMARACARIMIEQGTGGAIVNIGSIFGQQGVANGAGYSASKGGIALLPFGIRVNTIAPGNMLTEMHLDDLRISARERGVALEDEVERVRATVPLGRHGIGDDIAGAIAWLASPDAGYVTGQTIGVNGGVVLT